MLGDGSVRVLTFPVWVQEEGQAAVLSLACGREASGMSERILVARIGASQEGDHQAIQVQKFLGAAVHAFPVHNDLFAVASADLPALASPGSTGTLIFEHSLQQPAH